MELLYAKRFNKDLDAIRYDKAIRKRLLELIEKIKQANSLADLKDVRKVEGYRDYYRIKLGDYRLGMKLSEGSLELIRFPAKKSTDVFRSRKAYYPSLRKLCVTY